MARKDSSDHDGASADANEYNQDISDEGKHAKENVSDITLDIIKNLSNMSIASPVSPTCTKEQCKSNTNEHMLQCSKCKLSTHYACTDLPPYQVYLFTRKNYRLYICINCIDGLPKEIVENCLKDDENGMDAAVDILEKRVEELSVELERKTAELDRSDNVNLEDENKRLTEKIKQLEEHQDILRKHIEDKDKTIKTMLCKNNEKSPVEIHHKSIQVEIPYQNLLDSKLSKIEENMTHLYKNMENKLEGLIESKFVENMKTMDKKLNDVFTENMTYAEKLKETVISGVTQNSASINTINTEGDFRSIIKDQRNEELIQEQERKGRSQNLIIHGVAELNEEDSIPKKKAYDEEFVTSFLTVIDIGVKPKAILRLGNAKSKNRPIKLVMANEQEKDSIMGNLRKLKDAEEKYKKLRITDDLTMEEREEIKKWVNKANSKTTEEGESSQHVWRVRGTPKNGLRLVKVTRR
jgi:hypothetical protein